jgi:uncharacterized cupin superfamily protein
VSPRVNVNDVVGEPDASDPPGFQNRAKQLGPLLGAERLGATIYELPQGQSTCPYHYEYGREEWLFVLDGNPILRDPEGEHRLEPGDVVVFPEGPDGAHKLTNPDPGTARIMILSNTDDPSVGSTPTATRSGYGRPGSSSGSATRSTITSARSSNEALDIDPVSGRTTRAG